MDDLSKYYQLLGLEAGASPEAVKLAYHDLVKVWHPDRFAHDERLRLIAQDKLKEINGAYELLKAHAFQESIAPEPPVPEAEAAEATPPARNRAALWTTLVVLALVLIAGAAFLFLRKGRDANAAVSPVVATNNLPTTTTRYAVNFDQSLAHVAIATTGSLTGTFTVECWAMNRRPLQGGTIVSSRAPNDFSFDIKFKQRVRFEADIGDGSQWLVKMANAKFAYKKDIWYHIAYVVTPTNYSVYIDGAAAEDGQYPRGNPMLYDANHQLLFGLDKMDSDDLFGSIAEVRIWRTARTQKEIVSSLNQTLTGNEPGLQGYWRFAEGVGTDAADSSGHGFTGTLTGAVSWSKKGPPVIRH